MTTVKKLIELLSSYPENMVVLDEQNSPFIHIVNTEDCVRLSTTKPIGICKRTGSYVYPSVVEGYEGFCPELDEDLFGIEFIRLLRDKNGKPIATGDTVNVPCPTENDQWQHEFTGIVVDMNRDSYVVVEDGDGDCWTIEPELLEVDNE